jgi:hypothetical protein
MFIRPDVYDVSLVQRSAVVATGILSVFAVVCYLYALDLDEASFITPFHQTVPIFCLPVCGPSCRRDFLDLFKRQKVAVVGLIALGRILFSASEAVTLCATLLAPVALVLLVLTEEASHLLRCTSPVLGARRRCRDVRFCAAITATADVERAWLAYRR